MGGHCEVRFISRLPDLAVAQLELCVHGPVVVEAELGEQQGLPLVLGHVGQLGGGGPPVVGQGGAHTVLGQDVGGPGVAAHWTRRY